MLLVALLLVSSIHAEIPISRPDIVPLDRAAWSADPPSVASGDGFLVVWSERLFGGWPGPVKLRTYDDDGTPRQPLSIELGHGHSPHAFWNGSEYVVVFALPISRFGSPTPLPSVVAVRVRADGTIVEDSRVTLLSSRSSAGIADVAWDGMNALVAIAYPTPSQLLRLDRNGNLLEQTTLDAQPTALETKAGGGFFVLPLDQGEAVARGDDRFAVLDHQQNGVTEVILLDAAGSELERFVLSSNAGWQSAIVWDGRAWVASYTQNGALCTARFTSSSDVDRTCDAQTNAYGPALAVGGRGIFKAWTNDGQVLTDSGLASTAWSSAVLPAAVIDETGVLAAWVEAGRIRIGGIANDRTPRPEETVGGAVNYDAPVLSRAGNQTLLAWIDDKPRAVIIGSDGKPVSDPIELPEMHSAPAIAARGDEWVLAWYTPNGIQSSRLTRDLELVGFEEFGGTSIQDPPRIAATATGYLLAWTEHENGRSRVVVEPLDANGRRTVGGIHIADDVTAPSSLAVECGPVTCVVTWQAGQGERWFALVRHDGTQVSANRVFESKTAGQGTVVDALHDASFRIYFGNTVMPVSRAGEPGLAMPWHSAPVAIGSVVTWRGRVTAVYSRPNGGTSQVFAREFVSRGRSIRH